MASTWLITGSSSGFGRLIMEKALKRGDRVAATSRDITKLAALEEGYSGKLLPLELDLTNIASVRATVDAAFQQFGRIDVVVSNAGYGLLGAAEEATDMQVRNIIDTNLVASIALIQACLPHLRKQKSGRILQVSSEGGQIAYPGFSLYHATKWGIEGFVEAVGKEMAAFGIELSLIEPGPARTNFVNSVVRTDYLKAYDGTPAHLTAEYIDSGAWVIKGDPVRMADAMMRLADQDQPLPKRLVLGADAFEGVRSALVERLTELDAQKQISIAADFTPEELD